MKYLPLDPARDTVHNGLCSRRYSHIRTPVTNFWLRSVGRCRCTRRRLNNLQLVANANAKLLRRSRILSPGKGFTLTRTGRGQRLLLLLLTKSGRVLRRSAMQRRSKRLNDGDVNADRSRQADPFHACGQRNGLPPTAQSHG
jgi:hypothetical protein